MGWIGGMAGFFCGRQFGGVLGGIAGAVLGSVFEESVREKARAVRTPPRGAAGRTRTGEDRELIFLTAVGAMLAKLSKADGHVDETEIAAGERAFVRLGLTPEKRAFCIRAFRAAKQDGHSIYDYASAFSSVVQSRAVRELFYDILWDLACADGVVTEDERTILENIPPFLGVRVSLYAEQLYRRLGSGRRTGGGERRRRTSSGPVPSPYETLGCGPDATDAELRRAFREKAKKLHPDLLRAQGLPEDFVARANEQMARLNAAWDQIKRERNLK